MIRYICAQPAMLYYAWQVEVWLNSLLQFNVDPKSIHVVCSKSTDMRGWQALTLKHPTVRFAFYEDTRTDRTYISSIRPHILAKHWLRYPELQNDSIYYCDCDIIFLRDPIFWLHPLLNDNITYLSDARGYVGYEYFCSKLNDVSHNREEFDIDAILFTLFDRLGHDLDAFKAIDRDSGGAQHLLKNVDRDFWLNIEHDSTLTYQYFNHSFESSINRKFFANESQGFQSWTSDMWAMVWNLSKRNATLRIATEMDFAWPGYSIEPKWNVLHNAGVIDGNGKMFYKGNYQNDLPYSQSFDNVDPTIMSVLYVQAIKKTALTSCLG